MTEVVLTTFNAPRRRRRHTPAAVRRLAEWADVIALQEWGTRGRLLEDLAAFDHYDPKGARPPVVWRSSRVRRASSRSEILAKGRRVGRVPGFRSRLGDYRASVVRLVLDDGLVLVVVNVHLPAHVERRGRVARTKRGAMWAECVEAIACLLAKELVHADVAVALGDWNMRLGSRHAFGPLDDLGAIRLRSHEPTRGRREIDGGFLVSRPDRRPRVLKADALRAKVYRRASDHRPARFLLAL